MAKTKIVNIECCTCKICGKEFKTEEDAKKCEAKGIAVKWWENWDCSSDHHHVGEELEIGDIIMQCIHEGADGIDKVVVVGLVPKGHQIWPVVESLYNPEPEAVEPECFYESYILEVDETKSMKWLLERSAFLKDKMTGKMQEKKECEDCSSTYKNGCSQTLKECLQKQREYVEKIKNGEQNRQDGAI